MKDIQSAVICRTAKGYVAYLRFADQRHDTNLSAPSRWLMHNRIDNYISGYGKA